MTNTGRTAIILAAFAAVGVLVLFAGSDQPVDPAITGVQP